MNTVYKYRISVTDRQIVEMPFGAKILTAQVQDGYICLWAQVDTEAEEVPRIICICGTGTPLHLPPNELRYIATVQDFGCVWHVFEPLLLLAPA